MRALKIDSEHTLKKKKQKRYNAMLIEKVRESLAIFRLLAAWKTTSSISFYVSIFFFFFVAASRTRSSHQSPRTAKWDSHSRRAALSRHCVYIALYSDKMRALCVSCMRTYVSLEIELKGFIQRLTPLSHVARASLLFFYTIFYFYFTLSRCTCTHARRARIFLSTRRARIFFLSLFYLLFFFFNSRQFTNNNYRAHFCFVVYLFCFFFLHTIKLVARLYIYIYINTPEKQ